MELRSYLGTTLVEQGVIDPKEMEYALKVQEASSEGNRLPLGELLCHLGFVSEDDVVSFLAQQKGIAYTLIPDWRKIDPCFLTEVPEDSARRFQVLPFYREEDQLFVFMGEPSDEEAIAAIKKFTGCFDIHRVQVPKTPLRRLIERSYRNVKAQSNLDLLVEAAEEGRAEELIDFFLKECVKLDATDLHISPTVHGLAIIYRIDGVLETKHVISAKAGPFLHNVISMKAHGKSADREGQDLAFEHKIGGHKMTCRVSTIPVKIGGGEENFKIVIRIQDPARMNFQIETLGISEDTLGVLKEQIQEQDGIILIVGPIGSGKTSTLYAGVQEANGLSRNIFTIEDPIEFDLPTATQVEVSSESGLSYESAMEKSLRQDVDVMLLGEMRNAKTMNLAIEFALQGKLVFSTLHATDAPTAILRLLDKGIQPNFISATVRAIMAQRLLRTVCSSCKIPEGKGREHERFLGEFEEKFFRGGVSFITGKGCLECGNTGYRGRTPVTELMVLDETITKLIEESTDYHLLREKAIERGMRTLRLDAWLKVEQGLVDLKEIKRKGFF